MAQLDVPTSNISNSKKKSKSVLGPTPSCIFGPKGVTSFECSNNSKGTGFLDSQILKWSTPPENVLIIKRLGSETDAGFTSIASWLINEKNLHVYVEEKLLLEESIKSLPNFASTFKKLKSYKCNPNYGKSEQQIVDLIITVGGDGTLLYAAALFEYSMPPVIAFNAGSLGFLTSHDLKNYKETVKSVLKGNATLMLRSRLRCKLVRKSGKTENNSARKSNECGSNENKSESFLVLNEVVVNRGASQYLCNLDLYLEDRKITSVQGDGLIISTPTGSTAYALAAGASMVHPNVPSIMVTPICPHSLSFRPVVVPSGAELKFTVSEHTRSCARISFDGRCSIEIHPGDFVTVRTSIHPAPCVCKTDPLNDWFESLSECLHWNSRQMQASLKK